MRKGKNAFSFEISRTSNSSFSETTVLDSSIKVWIDVDIVLKGSWMEQSLILSLRMEY